MIPAVEARHLAYAYGDRPVLKDISFSVEKGDFFVIIGPNGSGKTTLMRIISGFLKPGNGRLAVMGRPIGAYTRRTLARTIAMVPQAVSVEFPFTVMELVLMGRSPHQGILGLADKADRDLARQAMSFTGVEELSGRRLNQLSGGECQRVFIARAICQDPGIMLLDEPTASLDLAHQVRVMDLMERLRNEKGVTVVMVSHDVNLAAMYGNRLLLLKDGRILSLGAPGEVLTYETLEAAYECALLVDESPLGKFQRVTPVPERFMAENRPPSVPLPGRRRGVPDETQ